MSGVVLDASIDGTLASALAPAVPQPVRLALLVDQLAQPAWVAAVLDRVAAAGTATLVGVGMAVGLDRAPALGLAHAAYLRLDARRYGRPDHPTRLVDLTPHLGAVDVIEVGGQPTGGRWTPNGEGVRRMRALGADVVWYLGRTPLAEPVPAVADCGVWALDPVHGADGLRAVCDGVPTTVTTLRRLTDGVAPGHVVAAARTSTKLTSVAVNHAEHVGHVVALVAGSVERAGRGGSSTESPRASSTPDPTPAAGLGVSAVAGMTARIATRLVRTKLADVRTTRRWFLGYHFSDVDGGAPDSGTPVTDPRRYTELLPPKDRYWADPFPVAWEGRHYLFYEEHLDGVRDAHLSVAELDPARGLVEPRVVLRRPYHLSFPSVFRWDGAWYMTPETATEEVVQLYRAERFPDDWVHVGDLVRGERFVDPVVAQIDGRWWMFVGVLPTGTAEASALHVYHADTPLGPWVPHARNPVAIDVRTARPAGRVFLRDGAYHRPVQDGARGYGHSMAIHRIDVLTPTGFLETQVARVEPTWRPGLVGTHTLNAAGRVSVLDALRQVPRKSLR